MTVIGETLKAQRTDPGVGARGAVAERHYLIGRHALGPPRDTTSDHEQRSPADVRHSRAESEAKAGGSAARHRDDAQGGRRQLVQIWPKLLWRRNGRHCSPPGVERENRGEGERQDATSPIERRGGIEGVEG